VNAAREGGIVAIVVGAAAGIAWAATSGAAQECTFMTQLQGKHRKR
jgi:hypothetical protein